MNSGLDEFCCQQPQDHELYVFQQREECHSDGLLMSVIKIPPPPLSDTPLLSCIYFFFVHFLSCNLLDNLIGTSSTKKNIVNRLRLGKASSHRNPIKSNTGVQCTPVAH